MGQQSKGGGMMRPYNGQQQNPLPQGMAMPGMLGAGSMPNYSFLNTAQPGLNLGAMSGLYGMGAGTPGGPNLVGYHPGPGFMPGHNFMAPGHAFSAPQQMGGAPTPSTMNFQPAPPLGGGSMTGSSGPISQPTSRPHFAP